MSNHIVIMKSENTEDEKYGTYTAVSPKIDILQSQVADSLSPAKTTPGSRKHSNRRTKDVRNRSGPVSVSGGIPGIPQKVVGIVALDVIESYGPIDMSNPNFKSPDSTPAERHIVAVKETTLYEETPESLTENIFGGLPLRTQSRKNSQKLPSSTG